MFRKLIVILFTVFYLSSNIPFYVSAAESSLVVYEKEKTGKVNDSSVRARTGPGTSFSQLKIDGTAYYYEKGMSVKVTAEDKDKDGAVWYKVKYTKNEKEYESWIHSNYLNIDIEIVKDSNFEKVLEKQGFPESYREALRKLHTEHPEWNFVAYHTDIAWSTVVAKESKIGLNLIDGTNIAYRSVDPKCYDAETGKFIPYDGKNWYCANSETIAYYLDPRNFLDGKRVFMFLDLGYKEDEMEKVVQKVLNSTFMKGTESISGKKFAQLFVESGKKASVSPVYLAALSRQEMGVNGCKTVTGEEFEYKEKTYKGLYNFFNIGASGGSDSWKKGLVYANGGADGTATSNGRPWTSPEKAIKGAGTFIANGYINVGQNTMYFQKFNVTKYKTYSHQYMTNVRSAYSQSGTIYATYANSGCLDMDLTFIIPVYLDMVEKTALPTSYTLPGVGSASYQADLFKGTKAKITSAAQTDYNQVTVKYPSVENAEKYQILRSTSKSGTYEQVGESKELTYKDNSALPGKTYYYKVRAVRFINDTEVRTASSDYLKVALSLPKPKISSVTADKNSWSMKVDWNDNKYDVRYVLYYSTKKSSGYSRVGVFDESKGVFAAPLSGKTYYFKVRAVVTIDGTDYYSAYSNIVSKKLTLTKPVISKLVKSDADTITVKYGSVSGADYYEILRSTKKSSGYTVIGTSKTTSYADKTVVPNKTYYYKIKAVADNGTIVAKSANSAIKSTKITLTAPKISSIKTASKKTQIKLDWNDSAYDVSYEVYYSTKKSSGYKKLDTVTASKYTFKVPAAKKTYYFKVRIVVTINGRNYYSPYSKVKSQKIT